MASRSQAAGIILSLAYIIGLIVTAISWGGYGLLTLGLVCGAIVPRLWRTGPTFLVWIVAGVVGFAATFYFQLRVPQPEVNDISQFLPPPDAETPQQVVTVRGQVISSPRLTRNQQVQFELAATQLTEGNRDRSDLQVRHPVTGKLYVTVPILQGTGLHPGQDIPVIGVLYDPKPATNPGAFDFSAYLARKGIFAGMRGQEIQWQAVRSDRKWGLWAIRQRIIRAQAQWLGSPTGPLVSAMVLGRRSVDLPYDIRDRFIQVGLAHALAASGFHVTLILGLVLALTKRFPDGMKLSLGTATLVVYAGLAGFQASVLRAAIMGFGGLMALVLQRNVKPLGVLLLAATLLLLYNPLWIWDLGFELSFLATLGLIVTVQPLVKWMDWLPVAIASLIAVPISATIWTLPLQLYTFKLLSTYSLLVNLISVPFLSLITIGGFVSGIASLMYPAAGSGLAWLLYYPIQGLMAIVRFFSQLPGNIVAVGTIAFWQLWVLYGLIASVCGFQWWQEQQTRKGKKSKPPHFIVFILLFLLAFGVVVIPAWQRKSNLFQVTVLDTRSQPILVLQDRWNVTVINSGNDQTVRFTLLPFLQSQGINRIDAAVETRVPINSNNGWLTLLEQIPIERWYYHSVSDRAAIQPLLNAAIAHGGSSVTVSAKQSKQLGSTSLTLLSTDPPVWQFQVQDRAWIVMENLDGPQQDRLVETGQLSRIQVLCWSGNVLSQKLLETLQPDVVIAMANGVDEKTAQQLQDQNIQFYWTRRDGAVQWKQQGEFSTIREATEDDHSLL